MTKKKQNQFKLSPKQRVQALKDAGITSGAQIHRRLRRTIKISKSSFYNYLDEIRKGKLNERKTRKDSGLIKSILKISVFYSDRQWEERCKQIIQIKGEKIIY